MAEKVLSINNLSKRYGRIQALDGLSLEVEKGNVFGILGPNGSGKTTTLGIILSVINHDSGYYKWFGQPPSKHLRKRIGAIVDVPIFYPYLSGLQNLKIFANIRHIPYDDIPRVLKIVDLTERRRSSYRTYSLGMKQRLAIAAALLGKPHVLILDEPTNGLDPKGIAEIRNLIIEIASQGITIILASHLLDEVQKICSHVAVLDKGRDIFSGRVDEITADSELVEISSDDMKKLINAVTEKEEVESFFQEGNILVAQLRKGYNGQNLNKYLFENGITLSHLAARKKTLEKHFLELLKLNGNAS